VNRAWVTLQAGRLPAVLAAQMTDALDALTTASQARRAGDTRQAANRVTLAALDLRLRHVPVPDVDIARLDLWARQVLVDAAAGREGTVRGDVAILETVWDRVDHTLDAPEVELVGSQLEALRNAADDGTAAARDAVPAFREAVATL
jgi:hypothetical protein